MLIFFEVLSPQPNFHCSRHYVLAAGSFTDDLLSTLSLTGLNSPMLYSIVYALLNIQSGFNSLSTTSIPSIPCSTYISSTYAVPLIFSQYRSHSTNQPALTHTAVDPYLVKWCFHLCYCGWNSR